MSGRKEVTHCVNGHEYTPENTRYEKKPNGRRQKKCRICDKDRQRRYHKERKLEGAKREAWLRRKRESNARYRGKSVEDLKPYIPRLKPTIPQEELEAFFYDR